MSELEKHKRKKAGNYEHQQIIDLLQKMVDGEDEDGVTVEEFVIVVNGVKDDEKFATVLTTISRTWDIIAMLEMAKLRVFENRE